ncbi:1369_t:CDS:2 [Funneliformis mosseae]|uniref:1369_t:CDS:1 n=1 Tax=Funneliformis mosseae TaxID=27381 RepID=A0A9N9BSP7_FUNMO|nr:1369_t:CDS:2 [Funneliformis mosseae]
MTRKRSISSVIHEKLTTFRLIAKPTSRKRLKVSCLSQEDIKLLQPNVENKQDEETLTTLAALGQTFN